MSVADPDLQLRGGGHPEPEIKGGSLQNNFLALRASFSSKNNGGGQTTWAPPLDPPLSVVALVSVVFVVLELLQLLHLLQPLNSVADPGEGHGGACPPPLIFRPK